MSKIIVTGGAGFIGTNLCKKLIELGEEVICIDDYSSGSKDNHIEGVTYVESDCKYIDLLPEKPKALFHLGEYSKVAPSFKDTKKILETNIYGTAKVIEYCKDNGVKIIYAASSTKHSKDGESQSPYAFSKATNTELIKNYGKWFNLKYSICYFYNNYGPHHDTCNDGWETVISIFGKQKLSAKPLTIVLPGKQRRNYTHVEDTVEGLIAAWNREESDEYQLGSKESYNMFELAKLYDWHHVMLPERQGDRLDSVSSEILEETYEKLNWQPKNNLKEFIKENYYE